MVPAGTKPLQEVTGHAPRDKGWQGFGRAFATIGCPIWTLGGFVIQIKHDLGKAVFVDKVQDIAKSIMKKLESLAASHGSGRKTSGGRK